jgi:deazaflavin-dependent oxidoreductase (nitroreductase family)
MDFNNVPKSLLRLLKRPPRMIYALGLGPILGRLVLLLTTTGRKSGQARVTPLQYEEVEGIYYLAAARGVKADWYQNIRANARVKIRVKGRSFEGLAEPCTDAERIADFLELRLKRHPRMIKAMLRAEGLPKDFSREDLRRYAARLALVSVYPLPVTTVEEPDKLSD